jgi:hypothetical protein
VRTITPNPFGLMDCTFFYLSFFSLVFYFFEIETRSENGTKTINLPARDSSALILGPLVDIGSFTTCTKMD